MFTRAHKEILDAIRDVWAAGAQQAQAEDWEREAESRQRLDELAQLHRQLVQLEATWAAVMPPSVPEPPMLFHRDDLPPETMPQPIEKDEVGAPLPAEPEPLPSPLPAPETPHTSVVTAEPAVDHALISVASTKLLAERRAEKKEAAKQLTKRLKPFQRSVLELISLSEYDEVAEAQAKALICEARGLAALEDTADEADHVSADLAQLREHFNRHAKHREFFGLNPQRTHRAEVWFELSEAYLFHATAWQALPWYEEALDAPPTDRGLVYDGMAAAEAYLYRVFNDRALSAVDSQQKRLHERLLERQPDGTFIPYWKANGDGVMPREDVRAVAAKLESRHRTASETYLRKRVGDSAMSQLAQLVGTPSDGDFSDNLLKIVDMALGGGIQPSNKTLVNLLLPYRHLIDQLTHPQGAKLLSNLAKAATEMVAKRQTVKDVDDDEDPEHENRVAALREKLSGKTILFLGGNKGQGFRQDDYQRQLGATLEWPNMEETTNPNALNPYVNRADLVCLVVRFSRHSYKRNLDDAKAQGKMTATLPRGTGFRTVVNDLYRQLFPDRENSPSSR